MKHNEDWGDWVTVDSVNKSDTNSLDNLCKRLSDIKSLLNSAQSEVEVLTSDRKRLVAHGFKMGLSAIKMGELLGITRQRVYRLVEMGEEEWQWQ